ncbi:hypothetical protein MHA_2329 [Mannheimia haemolytica PHL213]|nr:hypothetical protein MHA_2329 [Mannheimia haemolytica PHL213]
MSNQQVFLFHLQENQIKPPLESIAINWLKSA